MSNVIKLSDIQAQPIKRCYTGFDELDWIYGNSQFPDHLQWGMPQGKISLWSGQGGTGKSRLCIEVSKRWSKMFPTDKILYILTESPLSDFASWTKDTSEYQNIHCSNVDKIDDIISVIYEVKPNLIFIDSVNEIEDFIGNANSTRRLIKGIDNKIGLKKAVDENGSHLILLGQLNSDGTIKGGTSLPHAVDVVLDIIPAGTGSDDDFIVKVGIKNRHGKKSALTIFTHTDNGVINISECRLKDPVWRKSHGIADPTKPKLVQSQGIFTLPDGTKTDTWGPINQAYYEEFKKSPEADKIRKKLAPSLYSRIGNFLDNLING